MPLAHYPKLGHDSGAKQRIRKGHLTVAQLQGVMAATPDLCQRTAFKTLYYCALRASELGLQPIEHFDPHRGVLDILRLKGSLGHSYLLEPWVLGDLKKWVQERPGRSPYLFPNPRDPKYPLDRFDVYRWWQAACERADVPKPLRHPHVLKHSIATHMFDRGDDIYFIQQWLGHKKLENTQVYAELAGKRLGTGQQVMRKLMEEFE